MRLLTLLVLAACSGATTSAPRPQVVDTAPRIAFRPLEITPSHLDARGPSATTSVAVDGREVAIDLHTLYRSGEGGFGVLHDADGAPIPRVCDEQDFNALHEAHGEIWLTSHFECTPGGIYLTRLAQDPTTGLLSTLDTHEIDATGVHGLWFPCSGQVSPWGTHLGSEEYEPNARGWSSDGQPFASASYGWAEMMAWFPDPSVANPYRYGWTPEVTVTDAAGATTLVKHLAPGRFSHEIAYVLPDRRTTYLSDDGYGGGLFLFVADAPTDLSAGWLYALRWDQLEGASDRAAVAWVPLGHATDAAIEALIEAKVGFDELFEATEPQGTTCPEGFSWVHTRFRAECLKLRPPSARVPDPAMAASRLETRRFAAMKGASTELNKG